MIAKNLFGFCCAKGCHRKADFDIEVKAGEKSIKRKICTVHANELIKHCDIESMKAI